MTYFKLYSEGLSCLSLFIVSVYLLASPRFKMAPYPIIAFTTAVEAMYFFEEFRQEMDRWGYINHSAEYINKSKQLKIMLNMLVLLLNTQMFINLY